MGIVKNFIDELEKHRLLVYFVTFWGIMLFLLQCFRLVKYDFIIRTSVEMYIIDLIYHFSELFAGALLMVIGLKLIRINLLNGIKTEKLIIYFLILWASSIFFWGLWYVLDLGSSIFTHLENVLGFIGALSALFAGIVLWLFARKLLSEIE